MAKQPKATASKSTESKKPTASKSTESKKPAESAARKTRASRGTSNAAPRRRPRRREIKLAFEALSIEGGLLSPEWLALAAQLQATQQTPTDYRIPKGLNLRDEIGRYWRIAQAHYGDLAAGRAGGADPAALAERFVLGLFRDCFGFQSLAPSSPVELAGRTYPIGHAALGGRVPVVIAPAGSGLDTPSLAFGDDSRRRSAFGLCQEYLNAADGALWGMCTDGITLRLLRDNVSLTRPAWIEADLGRMFTEERYADFAALWLLDHESRFGRADQPVSECALEAWRTSGLEKGTRAREFLRTGVEDAVVALGQGFLAHPDNTALRSALESGQLTRDAYFQELLRLVYRLIFLLTVEERELLHPPGSDEDARALYAAGYGMRHLRERSVKRSAHDRHADLWEAAKIVLRGVATGEPRLALPALAGIFARSQCPYVDAARLENRALLLAVFKLSWLREDGGLARVNWRDMGPEELGSVYESLLELVPQVSQDRRSFGFATGGETKGNARKTTGSYYTPDSLVQLLLESALEPVVADTIARHPTRPADALLELSIVDPACGSGHFLLAAARRLAGHVARLQASGTPSAQEYRQALRQVVGHCIYGVDLNPMAVELCKVSLWMEAVEPGRPLTFLDAHIRCGNSLLGTTPKLMAGGIPDAAFEPIEGDDRKVATAFKKRNKASRTGQQCLELGFLRSAEGGTVGLVHAVQAMDAASDADLGSLEHKQLAWQALLDSQLYLGKQLVADAWCTAFVWKKEPGPAGDLAPTHDVWHAIQADPISAPPALVVEVRRLAGAYRFFHWHLAFPQVFARGGFDVVIGNPPWERVKLEEKQWFDSRNPEIAHAKTASIRKQLIAKLDSLDHGLLQAFLEARRAADAESHFLRASGRFPLTGVGDVNTYAVFTELAISVVAKHGAAGIIVPTGLLTDDQLKIFSSHLIDSERLSNVYGFENEEFLFPGIANVVRFCAMTISGSGQPGRKTRMAFYMRKPEHISQGERFFDLCSKDLELVNPNTRTCPVFRTNRDAQLTLRIYSHFPVLRAEEPWPGDWNVKYLGMFHMANDSDLFLQEHADATLPLYEAKLIWHYDHRFGSYELKGKLRGKGGRGLPDMPVELHQDPEYQITPQFWVPQGEVTKRLANTWSRKWLLAYRTTSSAKLERTIACAIIPLAATNHKTPLIFPCKELECDTYIILCCLNSIPLDYIARQKIGGTDVGYFHLDQLPIPRSKDFSLAEKSFLRDRALELSYTTWNLKPFAQDLGFDGPPYQWHPGRRFEIQCEIDAFFARFYGLSRDELVFILDAKDALGPSFPGESFRVLQEKEVQKYGRYRTKRVILEIYDAMAEAPRAGMSYQTRLDPPPADPRVAHPPRKASGSDNASKAKRPSR